MRMHPCINLELDLAASKIEILPRFVANLIILLRGGKYGDHQPY